MTTDKAMTLEQAIAYLHPHVNSSHNADWKTKRAAWDVLMAHLAPREVSDEDVERAHQASLVIAGESRPWLSRAITRAALQADRQRVGGVALGANDWRCSNCRTEFNSTDELWRKGTKDYLSPCCPYCKANNQYTYAITITGLIDRLEHYPFRCEAGDLKNCQDWMKVKEFIRNQPSGCLEDKDEAYLSAVREVSKLKDENKRLEALLAQRGQVSISNPDDRASARETVEDLREQRGQGRDGVPAGWRINPDDSTGFIEVCNPKGEYIHIGYFPQASTRASQMLRDLVVALIAPDADAEGK